MTPRMRIEVAGLAAYEVLLDRELNTVGRAVDNSVGLRDMNVSRHHFVIKNEGGGRCVVQDCGSRNGTMVNGELVKEHVLQIGDQIMVGNSVLTFLGVGEGASSGAPAYAGSGYPPGQAPFPNAQPAPGSGVPGSGVPGSGVPGSGVPGSGVPGSGAHGFEAPGSGAHSFQQPGTPGSGSHAFAAGTPGSGVQAFPPRPPFDPTHQTARPDGPRPATPSGAPQNPGGDLAGGFADAAPRDSFPVPGQDVVKNELAAKSSSLFEDVELFKSVRSHQDRWRKLTHVMSIIGTEYDLDVLLESIVDALLQLVPSKGAFLVLHKEGTFRLRVSRNIDAAEISQAGGRLRLSTQICKQAVEERKPILTDSAQEDENLNQFLSVANLNIQSVLCMPFGVHNEVLGVVYLDDPDMQNFLEDEDELLEIVAAFGNLAGVSVQNAQLLDSVRQQERVDQELRIAARIQSSLLPKTPPTVPGLELAGGSLPAKEIGGDLYDFMVRPGPWNDLLIAIGDVSGKGVGAGLVGSSMRSLLHAFARTERSTDRILIEANSVLAADLEPGFFVSFLLIRINPESGEVFFTGAGHEHLVIYRAATNSCEKIMAGGVVLGISENVEGKLQEKPLTLDEGDMVVLYTDGATEQTDARGEEFGINRIGQVVLSRGRQSPDEVVQTLFETIKRFKGPDRDADDDLTVVAFRKKSR